MNTRRTLSLSFLSILILAGVMATSGLPAEQTENPAPEGPTATAQNGASAALLQDGRLLISGGAGKNGAPVSTAEIFKDGSYSQAASMSNARDLHASVTLKDGHVLV